MADPQAQPDKNPGKTRNDRTPLVLVKQGQRYVFDCAPGQEAELLADIARRAKDPDDGINWFDAAVLSHQLGQRMGQDLQKLLKPTPPGS